MNQIALRCLAGCTFAAAVAACATPLGASSGEHLRGVVVAVLAPQHEIVVRHEAYGGMPAMTMLFHVAGDESAKALHSGDRIAARVTETPAGSALSSIHVLAAAQATPLQSAVRSVRLLAVGDGLPNTRFVDQTGHPFTFADFAGKEVVLAFIYTRCRDPRMCPLISSNFHSLQKQMGSQAVHLVEITLDPAYDTPPVLARYARAFDADPQRWTLGTGDSRSVLDFAARFGIVPFPDPRIGLIHTERTALIDAHGKVVDFVDEAGWDAQGVMARLQAIDAVPSNPLARLDYELSKAAVAICGDSVARFSGLADLGLVLLIIAGGSLMLYRLATRIFREV